MLLAEGPQESGLQELGNHHVMQLLGGSAKLVNNFSRAASADYIDDVVRLRQRPGALLLDFWLAKVQDQFPRQHAQRVLFLVHRPNDADRLNNRIDIAKSGRGTVVHQSVPVISVTVRKDQTHPGTGLENLVHLPKRLAKQIVIVLAGLAEFSSLDDFVGPVLGCDFK